jgi:hypothetical protein
VSAVLVSLLTGATGAGLVLAAAVFLGRSVVQQWLARSLAKFQADLAQANALELEPLKGEIQRQVGESAARHSRLQDRLHEVLPDLFAAIQRYCDATGAFTALSQFHGEGSTEDRLAELKAASQGALDAFHRSLLYLPRESAAEVVTFLVAAGASSRDRSSAHAVGTQNPAEDGQHRKALLERARESFEKEVRTARVNVFMNFQKLLGVDVEAVSEEVALAERAPR